MNEEPMPGSSSADQELDRRWRRQSIEQPSSSVDEHIRAAARDAVASYSPQAVRPMRRSRRWTRFVPLAAAASVALLAVGLVRLIPREEYQAIPAPGVDRSSEARDAPAATHSESEADADARPGDASQLSEAVPVSPSEAGQEPDARTEARRSESRPTPGEAASAEKSNTAPSAEPVARQHTRQQTSFERAAKADDASLTTTTSAAPAEVGAAAPAASRRGGSATTSALPASLADRVQNDAARRTGVELESIRIVGVDPVAWLDASLGCDVPDSSAPETRVPGYIVTVEASGTTLRYHTDGRDRIAVCEQE